MRIKERAVLFGQGVIMAKNKKKIHWFREIGDAFGFFFSGAKMIFSVLLCILVTVTLIGTICGLIMGTTFALYLSGYVDSSVEEFDLLASEQKQTSQIFIDTGTGDLDELEDEKLYADENRVWVSYENIPANLINAYVAEEDKRFYDHNGVDWIRTAYATAQFVVGRADSGGSTLTQQLIKNITGDDDNTPQRKIEEIFRALNLEKRYSKEEILEMYLNTIYLSQGCNGVQAASYKYFGKPVSELELIECAAIAAITQNPARWDPKVHPENNSERRDRILVHMLEQGKITQSEFDEAYGMELKIYEEVEPDEDQDETPSGDGAGSGGFKSDASSWYADVVIEDTIKLLMEHYDVTYSVAEQMLFTSGLKIVIAMDARVQKVLEDIYRDTDIIDEVIAASPGMVKPQSAMVVLDPTNGNILGLVGGRGEKLKSRVLNYATQTTRQPGSSLKPLAVYGPSLQAGLINYSTIFDDSPYEYREDGTGWPKNSPAGYKGLTPVINALTRSVNTIAIKLVDRYGLQNSYDFLTEKLHITTIHNNEVVNGTVVNDVSIAALGLGGLTYGVSVRELVGGYTMFTNDGVFCEPRAVLRILDTDGKVLINNELKTEMALSKENASIMTKMMNNVMVNGTGASTKLKDRVFTAGKTGTTSKNNDRWFVGFTPYYLGGVWFGYEKAQSVAGFSGNSAMKIWDYCMTALHNEMVFQMKEDGSYDSKIDRFGNEIPKVYSDVIDPGVLTLNFCVDCGMLSTAACKDARGSRSMIGYFTVDNMPQGYCTCHQVVRYCSGGGIATEFCPVSTCKDVTIVVSESAKDRYVDGVYAYRSDETYVFYDKGDGTYGGLITKYSKFCTKHMAPSAVPVSAPLVVQAPPPKDGDKRELLD